MTCGPGPSASTSRRPSAIPSGDMPSARMLPARASWLPCRRASWSWPWAGNGWPWSASTWVGRPLAPPPTRSAGRSSKPASTRYSWLPRTPITVLSSNWTTGQPRQRPMSAVWRRNSATPSSRPTATSSRPVLAWLPRRSPSTATGTRAWPTNSPIRNCWSCAWRIAAVNRLLTPSTSQPTRPCWRHAAGSSHPTIPASWPA